MIRLEGVTKEYVDGTRALVVLREITLEIQPGEVVAMVGPSGSGKSTLLGLMAGLDVPTSGAIHVDGTDLTRLSVDEAARFRLRHMGFVFQAFHLISNLSALENVMIPLEIGRHEDPESVARQALARVELSDRLSHRPAQLSGGEQQRVAIARALAPSPRVLFVDEPTGNLDAETGERIVNLLFEVGRESHVTMVIVTHMPSLAARADRIFELRSGTIRLMPPL